MMAYFKHQGATIIITSTFQPDKIAESSVQLQRSAKNVICNASSVVQVNP